MTLSTLQYISVKLCIQLFIANLSGTALTFIIIHQQPFLFHNMAIDCGSTLQLVGEKTYVIIMLYFISKDVAAVITVH